MKLRALVRSAIVLTALPTAALADNCGGLADCFGSASNAAIAGAAVVAVAAVVILATGGGAAVAAVAVAGAEGAGGAEAIAAAAAAGAEVASGGEAVAAAAAAGAEAEGVAGAAAAASAEGEGIGAAAAAAAEGEGVAAAGADAAAGDGLGASMGAGESAAGDAAAAGSSDASAYGPAIPGLPPEGLGSLEGTDLGGINSIGATDNCFYCSQAADNYMGGELPSAAGDFGMVSPAEAEAMANGGGNISPSSFTDLSDYLQGAGNGSRGYVIVSDSSGAGHVFNAVNNGGEIVGIDTQTGVYGRVADVAAHAGYSNPGVWFLPTFP